MRRVKHVEKHPICWSIHFVGVERDQEFRTFTTYNNSGYSWLKLRVGRQAIGSKPIIWPLRGGEKEYYNISCQRRSLYTLQLQCTWLLKSGMYAPRKYIYIHMYSFVLSGESKFGPIFLRLLDGKRNKHKI